MQSYPIWNRVDAPAYRSSKDFGAREYFEIHTRVGTSAQNSHHFADYNVTRHQNGDGNIVFTAWFDGEIVKRRIYDPKTWQEIE